MSHVLRVESGPSEGSQFVLEGEVLRVGGPQSAIQLPELPAHALTLVRERQGYAVINRMSQGISIGHRKLGPNDKAAWKHEQVLRTANGGAYRLTSDTGAAAEEKVTPPAWFDDQIDSRPVVNRGRQTAIVLIVGLLFAVYQFADVSERRRVTTAQNFNTLMHYLDRLESQGNVRAEQITTMFREARGRELLRDHREAVHVYTDLRDLLAQDDVNSDGGASSLALESQILKFVNRRLSQLR